MGDYKQRVLLERNELAAKLEALGNFLNSSTFLELTTTSQRLLTMQSSVMSAYLDILNTRIDEFA